METRGVAAQIVREENKRGQLGYDFILGKQHRDTALFHVFALDIDLPEGEAPLMIGYPFFCFIDKITGEGFVSNDPTLLEP